MPVANLPDMSVFAERLVAARKRKGWTQQQLAEAAGISITNVRNYEARGASPRTWTVYARLAQSLVETTVHLARALGVTVGFLIGETDDARAPR